MGSGLSAAGRKLAKKASIASARASIVGCGPTTLKNHAFSPSGSTAASIRSVEPAADASVSRGAASFGTGYERICSSGRQPAAISAIPAAQTNTPRHAAGRKLNSHMIIREL